MTNEPAINEFLGVPLQWTSIPGYPVWQVQ